MVVLVVVAQVVQEVLVLVTLEEMAEALLHTL
jgi:hypothetical protein